MTVSKIYNGNNLDVMIKCIDKSSIDLIYLDPPFFGTGMQYQNLWNNKDELNQYKERSEFGIDGYINWIESRLYQMKEILKPTGSIYLHCDHHSNAYIRLLMDDIFNVNNFKNEIIWSYSGGGASKTRFANKHDNILFYSKSKNNIFNTQYIPYKNPNGTHSGGKVYRKEGKLLEDWWIDIPVVSSNSKERLKYLTQKPEALLKRIIQASSNLGDIILDPFMGGGTTLKVAQDLGRQFIGIDIAKEACDLTAKRIGYTGKIINTLKTIPDFDIMETFKFQNYVCDLLGAINTNPHPDRPSGPDHGIDGIFTNGIYKGRALSVTVSKINATEVKECVFDMIKNDYEKGVLVSAKPYTKANEAVVYTAIKKLGFKDLELVYIGNII